MNENQSAIKIEYNTPFLSDTLPVAPDKNWKCFAHSSSSAITR